MQAGHVVPGLITRAHEARASGAPALSIWGTGKALREFMHVDDCADALVFLMKTYSDARIINVGTGEEVSIGDLARKVCNVVGYSGQLAFDPANPTECRASFWILRGFWRWAGAARLRSTMVCGKPTGGSWKARRPQR